MINNFDQILDLLEFRNEDDFYHLQLIQRKKEHADLGSNSRVVKTYYIGSKEYLEKRKQEIIDICTTTGARACINLNRRSFEKMAFQLLKKVTDQIMNKDFKSCRKAYESVCGAYGNEPNKKWIIDIDHPDENVDDEGNIREWISWRKPEGDKFIAKIPTKNGYHLIVKPFDLSAFHHTFDVDIHKDNPTIVYIP